MAMARVKIWQAWVGLIPSGIGQGAFPNHADKWQACAAIKVAMSSNTTLCDLGDQHILL